MKTEETTALYLVCDMPFTLDELKAHNPDYDRWDEVQALQVGESLK
jgi:hypothetical protein